MDTVDISVLANILDSMQRTAGKMLDTLIYAAYGILEPAVDKVIEIMSEICCELSDPISAILSDPHLFRKTLFEILSRHKVPFYFHAIFVSVPMHSIFFALPQNRSPPFATILG